MDSNRTEAPSPAHHDSAESGRDLSKPGVDPDNAPNVADHIGFDTGHPHEHDEHTHAGGLYSGPNDPPEPAS